MAIEKQPLAATPGMFSVGMEATINIGNYENIRVGLVQSFAEAETKHRDAYLFVLGQVTAWAAELHDKYPVEPAPRAAPPIRRASETMPTKPAQATPSTPPSPALNPKRAALMDALGGHASRLIITEREDMIIIRTRGQLERDAWSEVNVLVRGQGGSWRGTKDGLPGKEVHWEIPK